MAKIQLTESELRQIVEESAMRILNEQTIDLTPEEVAWMERLLNRPKAGKMAMDIVKRLKDSEVAQTATNTATQSAGNAVAQTAKKGTKVGRALKSAGAAVGTFAGTTAGAITIGAVAAAAVAGGTMLYLNSRNKKGLEALKQGMWDGHYPWENQQIVPWMPTKQNTGNGENGQGSTNNGNNTNTATTQNQETNQQATTQTVQRKNFPAIDNKIDSSKVGNGSVAQMGQEKINVPARQAVSTINNPRITQMQKNGRSAEAVGNAAIRQKNKTLKNMGMNQTQFNAQQFGNKE